MITTLQKKLKHGPNRLTNKDYKQTTVASTKGQKVNKANQAKHTKPNPSLCKKTKLSNKILQTATNSKHNSTLQT